MQGMVKRSSKFHFESQYGIDGLAVLWKGSIADGWDSVYPVQGLPYGTSPQRDFG